MNRWTLISAIAIAIALPLATAFDAAFRKIALHREQLRRTPIRLITTQP